MGQRSQIFIRVNKQMIVANYYQWNYGERMISRTRSIIEYLKEECLEHIDWYFKQKDYVIKAQHYCDVNFDMCDIVLHRNLFEECKEYNENFNDYAFNYDNNDGKLLVDIENGVINYCLLNYDNKIILNAEDYLKWDKAYNSRYKQVEWEKHYNKECIEYTKDNINYINENAKLMTAEQVKDYLEYNYNI